MAYLYDVLVDALGGSKLIGSQGMDYGKWSPNNYRSVIITLDGILVEGHLGGISIKKVDNKKAHEDLLDSRSRNMLNAFELKKFMGLEEVIIDSRLVRDIQRFQETALDDRGRFRKLSIVNFNETMFKILCSRIKDQRQKHPETLITDIFGLQTVGGAVGPSFADWFAKVNLSSKFYKVDQIGGSLYEHLRGIASAHGVDISGEEVKETEVEYNSKQVENITSHREAVKNDNDANSVEDIESVRVALSRLKNGLDDEKADKEGIKLLAKNLASEVISEGREPVSGLGYYLDTFGENDGVPAELMSLYYKYGLASEDETTASIARVSSTDGYLNVDKSVKKSVLRVMKNREQRKLYSPDKELYEPSGETLQEFVSLLVGSGFDFVRYSKVLQEIEVRKTGTQLEQVLETRKAEGGDVAIAVEILEGTIEDEEKNSIIGFWKDIQKGIASIGLKVFENVDKEHASTYGAGVLATGVKKGAFVLSNKYPVAKILLPALNKGVDNSEEYLIEFVGTLLDSIGKGLENGSGKEHEDIVDEDGKPSNDPGLDEQTERVLYELFETKIFWSFGLNMIDDLLTDSKEFSNLKHRQVKRISKASGKYNGLDEFVKKYSHKLSQRGIGALRELGYIDGSEMGGKDRAFDPEQLFSKLVDEFSNLSKRKERNQALKQVQMTGGIVWDNMKIYNSAARDLMGLRSRNYGYPEGV